MLRDVITATARLQLTDQSMKSRYLYQAQGTYNSGMLDTVLYVISMWHAISRLHDNRKKKKNFCKSKDAKNCKKICKKCKKITKPKPQKCQNYKWSEKKCKRKVMKKGCRTKEVKKYCKKTCKLCRKKSKGNKKNPKRRG